MVRRKVNVPYWSMPENTAHPTQKPEKLMAKLILVSSDRGDAFPLTVYFSIEYSEVTERIYKYTMGKQFGFIMDSIDENKLVKKILKNGSVLYSQNKKVISISSLPDGYWINVYFAKREDEENLCENYSYVDVLTMPVLELGQTFVRLNLKELQRGRIYYDFQYYGDNDELIYKNKELDIWYKEIVKWIKTNLQCVEIERNGKKVKEYVSESLLIHIKNGFKIIG